jgi:hydrogenase-4 membrane subunit HyfE
MDVDYVLRFLAGGLIVSAFAIVGDVLRPKSFAGLFGAAPSVALATLTLAIFKQGPDYVATEGHSMVLGAAAFLLYGFVVCQLLMRFRTSALVATSFALTVWLAAAFGLKQLVIG